MGHVGDRKCIVRYRGKKGDMGGIQGCMGNTVGKYRDALGHRGC